MKKINSIIGFSTLAAIVISFTVLSCKKKFDEPPTFVDPNIAATITVKQLKAMHTIVGAYDTIKTDQVLVATVVGDDKSGNLYKSIAIQDATGGISLRLDASNLYTTYPVGHKLYIKLKGLVLGDYGGMTQIGGGIDNSDPTRPSLAPIASIFFDKFIVPGSLSNPVPIRTITDLNLLKTDLQDTFQNTLIRLDNFEFAVGDTAKTFGDPTKAVSALNYTIKNCSGQSIILRNSSYATFTAANIPNGNGSIVALYTFFNGTKQLTLRDTSDIKFTNPRCFLFEENFDAYPTTGTAALSIPGWRNIMETGDVPYTLASFSGSTFAKVSAFSSAVMPTTNISSWLITPDVNIPAGTSPNLTFTSSRRYPAGTFKAYVSTNFTGSNVGTATWTLLATIPPGTASAFTPFDAFGPFNLSAYAGQKINIGFRYEAPAGTAANAVGTYEVDDIKITR